MPDNCNEILRIVRAKPGRLQAELGKLAGLKNRSSAACACKSLMSAGFISEKNGKYYATPMRGEFVRRKSGGIPPAEKALLAGQDLPHGTLNAEQIQAAALKLLMQTRAEAIEKSIAPPEPVAPAPSLFEKKEDGVELSPAEKLGRNLSVALDVDAQILALGVDPEDMRKVKVVGEASGRTLSAAAKIDENSLRREDYRIQNLDRLAALLKEKYDDSGALKVVSHDHS